MQKLNDSLDEIEQVTFEVTRECNLKCNYCIFSSREYSYRRFESSDSLNSEDALKTLTVLHQRIANRQKKNLTIGFYGGEPLLRINVIKDIIFNSRQIFNGWNLSFNITTNGVLLTQDITDYLAFYDLAVMVSLDGDMANHDNKRVFHNGKGSFRLIMNNLENWRMRNPDFYLRKVSFSPTYSMDLSFDSLYRFFAENETVRKNEVILSFVDTRNSAYYKRYMPKNDEFLKESELILDNVIGKIKRKSPLLPVEKAILEPYKTMDRLLKKRRFNELMGSCRFNKKFFVSADGIFHVCEKINHYFPIGDFQNGFDLKAMQRIASDYLSSIGSKCRTCAIRFLCSRCYIHFAQDGKFAPDSSFCEAQWKYTIHLLEYVIIINQAGGFRDIA